MKLSCRTLEKEKIPPTRPTQCCQSIIRHAAMLSLVIAVEAQPYRRVLANLRCDVADVVDVVDLEMGLHVDSEMSRGRRPGKAILARGQEMNDAKVHTILGRMALLLPAGKMRPCRTVVSGRGPAGGRRLTRQQHMYSSPLAY
jgi:hypothetical protein